MGKPRLFGRMQLCLKFDGVRGRMERRCLRVLRDYSRGHTRGMQAAIDVLIHRRRT